MASAPSPRRRSQRTDSAAGNDQWPKINPTDRTRRSERRTPDRARRSPATSADTCSVRRSARSKRRAQGSTSMSRAANRRPLDRCAHIPQPPHHLRKGVLQLGILGQRAKIAAARIRQVLLRLDNFQHSGNAEIPAALAQLEALLCQFDAFFVRLSWSNAECALSRSAPPGARLRREAWRRSACPAPASIPHSRSG